MQPLANNLPMQNQPVTSVYKPSRPKHSQSSAWISLLTELVTQCVEIFPQYGADDSSLPTRIKAFSLALEDYREDEISYAFRHWLRESSKMPTPAEIVYIASQRRKYSHSVADYQPARPAEPVYVRKVDWFGLSWNEIQAKGWMPAVEAHLVDLTLEQGKARSSEYLNYLKNGPQNAKTRESA